MLRKATKVHVYVLAFFSCIFDNCIQLCQTSGGPLRLEKKKKKSFSVCKTVLEYCDIKIEPCSNKSLLFYI